MGKSELKSLLLGLLRPEYPYSVCDLRSHCQRYSKTLVTRLAVTSALTDLTETGQVRPAVDPDGITVYFRSNPDA